MTQPPSTARKGPEKIAKPTAMTVTLMSTAPSAR